MATDLERAWHVFTFNPNALSHRFYAAHLRDWRIDERVESMRSDGSWPPSCELRKRWPDMARLIELCGDASLLNASIGLAADGQSFKLSNPRALGFQKKL